MEVLVTEILKSSNERHMILHWVDILEFDFFSLRVKVLSANQLSLLKDTKTGKKYTKSLVVKDLIHLRDRVVLFEDFKILASSTSDSQLKVKKILSISRGKSILNRNNTTDWHIEKLSHFTKFIILLMASK